MGFLFLLILNSYSSTLEKSSEFIEVLIIYLKYKAESVKYFVDRPNRIGKGMTLFVEMWQILIFRQDSGIMDNMAKIYKRFIFEQAAPEDGSAMLAILEDAAFKGNISLLYTRRPDAYRSFKQEGKDVDVVVARDVKNGKIVGFGACAIRELWVNGTTEKVGYLFGLRVARDYLGKYPILHRGYAYLHTLHEKRGISCYITTILEDNLYAQKLLEKQRSFMPNYHPFGSYEIFALKSAQSRRLSYIFRQACEDDIPSLVKFLYEQGRKYQFFPVIDEADLSSGELNGLSVANFYLLHTKENEILAAGVPWDQRSYKQYIVQGYSSVLKLLYPFSRIFPLFGYPSLPTPGSILQFFTLSFWAVKDSNSELFLQFLKRIAKISRDYPFFLIGLHERHPLRILLQNRPHISYKSKLYLVSWDQQRDYIENFDRGMLPYLECGML
jgi:hypothetical protein